MDIGKRIGLKYGLSTRNAFGEALKRIGQKDKSIVVVDGDVANSTRTAYFGKEFPERFFCVGIAESNLIGVASGLASCGKTAVASSFSSFLLCNGYDQIRMGVAFPKSNVKLVGSHSGINIGEDGPSQMGIEDIALATSLPNFTVVVPADGPSTIEATEKMCAMEGPVYLRTGRPEVPIVYEDGCEMEIGRGNVLKNGKDVTIIASGLMVVVALEAAYDLSQQQISARVVDMHTIKPIDEELIARAARETGSIVTVEEHLLDGGLGSAVARVVAREYPVPMEFIGIDNCYAESGKPEQLLDKYGLMPRHVIGAVKKAMKRAGSS